MHLLQIAYMPVLRPAVLPIDSALPMFAVAALAACPPSQGHPLGDDG